MNGTRLRVRGGGGTRGSGTRGRHLGVVLTLAGLFVVSGLGFDDLGDRNSLNLFLIYALVALGFYWIYGLSGQFSFAHASFVAVGGYTSAWLSRQGWPVLWAVVGAVLVTMACAALFLAVVRKASHFYFAIASLGLGSVVVFVLQKWDAFTGGTDGQINRIALFSADGFPLTTAEITTVLLWVLVVGYVVAFLVDVSPVRREAIALKHNTDVARVAGVRDLATRMALFVLGCAAAGVAGALLAHTNGFLGPESFGAHLSIGIFLMMVVGGETYLVGPLVGAAFYVFFPRLLHAIGLAEYENILFGATLILLMIFMPNGILRGLDHLRALLGDAVGAVRTRPPRAPRSAGRTPGTPEPATQARTSKEHVDGPSLRARDVRVSFGGVRAVDGVTVEVGDGEVLGLVGPNGSGKSTLLNALNGLVPATGRVELGGRASRLGVPGWSRRLGLVRTFQTPQIYDELSCLDNIRIADPDRRGTTLLAALFRPLYVARREKERLGRARGALAALGAEHLETRPVASLSYGERRWVELSRAVVADARVVLLDEPSAGLNDVETGRLVDVIDALREQGASVVLVDHKVDFISRVCDRIVVLDFGRVIAEGTPQRVFSDPLVIEAYTGAPPAATAEPAV